MADEEKADAIVIDNRPTRTIVGLWVVIPGAILGGILLYCLLTLSTIVVVSMFFLINTCIHLFKSMTGTSSQRKVVRPISDGGATIILVLSIVFLSASLGILRAVESREHRVLSFGGGLHVGQWIEICMIFLGYCTIQNGVQIVVNRYQASRPWVQGFVESIYCLLLIPTVFLVMKVVPSWEHKVLLGLPVWKLICAIILVILVQSAISLAMLLLKQLSYYAWCDLKGCKAQNCVYYYIKGLRRTLVFVSVALMHLLTWRLYFCPHFLKHASLFANRVSDFGTWTFVTELICALLWLIKNLIILSWQAQTIYERPEKDFFCQKSDKNDEILMRKLSYWCCLYSLGLIELRGGRPTVVEVKEFSGYNRHQQQRSWPSFIWENYKFKNAYDFFRAKVLVNTQEENNKLEWDIKKHKWDKAITTLIESVYKGEPSISIHTKQKISGAFLLDDRSLPEDHHIASLYERLYTQTNMVVDKEIHIDELDKIMERESSAVNSLKTEILKTGRESMRAQDFQALTEKAQQNCLQFRYFLISAQNVVKFLNRLMIGFVIVLGVIIWLLLTEILPTKVIVVFASPVLAATFIFGDTIKTVFQGIVFAYISHPFTVGHLCVIDKIQMEVKKIGIWRTTFSKLGTEEEVLYPNSDLANKAIINYGSNLQLLQDDYAEFSLKYGTSKRRIKCLTSSINDLVRQEKLKISDSTNSSPQLEKENIDQHKNTSHDSVAQKKESINSIVTRSASLPAGREKMTIVRSLSIPDNMYSTRENTYQHKNTSDDSVAQKKENINSGVTGSASLPAAREEMKKIVQSETVPDNMYSTRENTIKNLGSAGHEESSNCTRRNDDDIEEHSNCTRRNDDDIKWDDVVVKQIEGNIKMSFHFKHDESILDMTNAHAFNEIQMKKSRILRQIADLICKSNTFVGEE